MKHDTIPLHLMRHSLFELVPNEELFKQTVSFEAIRYSNTYKGGRQSAGADDGLL